MNNPEHEHVWLTAKVVSAPAYRYDQHVGQAFEVCPLCLTTRRIERASVFSHQLMRPAHPL